jgi:hypothetical protein
MAIFPWDIWRVAVDGSARCNQYAVGGWDRTLCGRGIAATMDHAMWTSFTAVYHAMGRVGRGTVCRLTHGT